jgi:hypothetical protein
MMGMRENNMKFILATGITMKKRATKPMKREESSSDGATSTTLGSTTLRPQFKN